MICWDKRSITYQSWVRLQSGFIAYDYIWRIYCGILDIYIYIEQSDSI